jgi:hypothetical protein
MPQAQTMARIGRRATSPFAAAAPPTRSVTSPGASSPTNATVSMNTSAPTIA